MYELTIKGSSDDLIEVGGQFTEEFTDYPEGEDYDGCYLAASDGTLLRIKYDRDGCWRINLLKKGTSAFRKTDGDPDDEYSDVATLTSSHPFTFVIKGTEIARAS